MANPILNELYDIRREMLDEHQDDLTEYLRAELAKSKAAGHPIAKIQQRSLRGVTVVKSGEDLGSEPAKDD